MSDTQFAPAAGMAQLIKERRTVRIFRDDPIPDACLLELLNTAVWAPNHGLTEPWRFIAFKEEGRQVFTDAVIQAFTAEEKAQYAEQRTEYYLNIPLHLIVTVKEDPRHKRREEDYAAACCLIQNLQLAAWEQGIGVVWKTNPYQNDPGFRERTGVQPDEKVVGVLHIGYPDKILPARPRTPAEELLTVVDRDGRKQEM